MANPLPHAGAASPYGWKSAVAARALAAVLFLPPEPAVLFLPPEFSLFGRSMALTALFSSNFGFWREAVRLFRFGRWQRFRALYLPSVFPYLVTGWVTAAGGAGWQLAEWIVEGDPGIDMLGVDPRRFGAYSGKRYTVRKNEETYRSVFTVHYPDEERPDARPAKTSPVYDKLDRMGAVWGQRYGWERANWFAPAGVERKDRWSFRRTNYFEHVGNECRRMREQVGIIDLTPFTKHEVSGPGAEAWLDSLVALWELYLAYGGFPRAVAAAVNGEPIPSAFVELGSLPLTPSGKPVAESAGDMAAAVPVRGSVVGPWMAAAVLK